MKQKSPQKLPGVQSHDLALIAVGSVPVSERHLAVVHLEQSGVGEGNPMGVAPQVVEDLLGAGEGGFTIDGPLLAGGRAEPSLGVARGAG